MSQASWSIKTAVAVLCQRHHLIHSSQARNRDTPQPQQNNKQLHLRSHLDPPAQAP